MECHYYYSLKSLSSLSSGSSVLLGAPLIILLVALRCGRFLVSFAYLPIHGSVDPGWAGQAVVGTQPC